MRATPNLAITALAVTALGLAAPRLAADEGPIQDNSFLIEEAYNQEAGVVQHISVLELPRHGGDWSFGFTQEWPLGGLAHQLSYTVPVARVGEERGPGDVALNYRYQLLGDGDAPVAMAPRLSLLLPSGDSDEGLGAGGTGVEVNLPLSAVLSKRLVGHWNLGASHTADAEGLGGRTADLDSVFFGQGFVWLARPTLNLMLETLWERTEVLAGGGRVEHEEALLLSPGLRFAQNLPNLQIVYGLGLPVEVGNGDGERSVLLYLSLEHPFRH
jgi:hypothetical protein